MIRLLIADDSSVAQEFLKHIFSTDPEIRVVGVAHNGQEAVDFAIAHRPDVITMDLHMPVLDGLAATRRIMEVCATPIVIVSGSTSVIEAALTFELLEAGALAVVLRPPMIGAPEFRSTSRNLIHMVKSMSEIRVVSRWRHGPCVPAPLPSHARAESIPTQGIRIVAIGASTGGPQALQRLLSLVSKNLPVPILIVQHIAAGFVAGFVEWLATVTGFPVHLATNGGTPLPGHVYVPPDAVHLGVRPGPTIELSHAPPEETLRPAVSFLFRSVARSMAKQAVGVLLTGMGKDGAQELSTLRTAGAITIAQDQASSVVFGMPGEAIRLGGAQFILPPEGIASLLNTMVGRTP